MGWCHEFGVTVREDCGHPMKAGESACQCPVCGVVCEGQFAGCATVWANGPREVSVLRPEGTGVSLGTPATAFAAPAPGAAQADPLRQPDPPLRPRGWPAAVGAMTSDEPGGQPQPLAERDAGKAAPTATADEGRGQILDWLQDSFDGLHAQLRVLSDALARQQQALAGVGEVDAAAARLSELADALPRRIGEAVREALTQEAGAHDGPTEAAGTAGAAAPPEPAAGAQSVTAPPAASGVRSHLGAVASTIQTRVSRASWQDKLRSLRPAESSETTG